MDHLGESLRSPGPRPDHLSLTEDYTVHDLALIHLLEHQGGVLDALSVDFVAYDCGSSLGHNPFFLGWNSSFDPAAQRGIHDTSLILRYLTDCFVVSRTLSHNEWQQDELEPCPVNLSSSLNPGIVE